MPRSVQQLTRSQKTTSRVPRTNQASAVAKRAVKQASQKATSEMRHHQSPPRSHLIRLGPSAAAIGAAGPRGSHSSFPQSAKELRHYPVEPEGEGRAPGLLLGQPDETLCLLQANLG